MKVSIVVPLYNKAEYVAECLESAISQTYKDFEIVAVNDGSTDNSAEVAKKYPVRFLDISNRGQSGARNAGILNSTADAILPLDADDWIDSEYLTKTVPRLTDGIGFVSTDMQRFGWNQDLIPAKVMTARTELQSNEIPVCSLIRRDALLEAGGYNSKVDGYEDWNLWIEILKRGWKMAVVNEPLFHYRCAERGANYVANQRHDYLVKTIHGFHTDIN